MVASLLVVEFSNLFGHNLSVGLVVDGPVLVFGVTIQPILAFFSSGSVYLDSL